MYTFVPLTSLGLLLFLAFCPTLFWSSRTEQPRKHPSYFPSPIPEVILSASLWSLAYLLRIPIYASVLFLLQRCSSIVSMLAFSAVNVTVFNLLRLSSLPILRLREEMQRNYPTWRDGVFQRVWWLALGWAAIDVAVGIAQSYAHLALYRNVMVPEERVAEVLADGSGIESHTPHLVTTSQEILPLSPRPDGSKSGTQSPRSLDEAIRLAVDQDLEQLVTLKEREEVEEIYGVPVIVRTVAQFVILTLTILHLENPRFRLVPTARGLHPVVGRYHPHPLRFLSTLCSIKILWTTHFFISAFVKQQAVPRRFPPCAAAQSFSQHFAYSHSFASYRCPHCGLC